MRDRHRFFELKIREVRINVIRLRIKDCYRLGARKNIGLYGKTISAREGRVSQVVQLPSPLLTDELPSLKIANGVHTRIKSLALRQGKSVTEIANEALEAYLNNLSADVRV